MTEIRPPGARAQLQRRPAGRRAGGRRAARRAGARRRAVGAGAVLGEGPEDRRPHDQRPRRDDPHEQRVQAAVRAAAVHRSRRRLLRVAEARAASAPKAARGSSGAATASRSRSPGCGRPGTTAAPGDDAPRLRTCVIITDRAQRAARADPRSHAGRAPGVGVGHVARRRQPRHRDACTKLLVPLPAERARDVDGVDAREQGRQQWRRSCSSRGPVASGLMDYRELLRSRFAARVTRSARPRARPESTRRCRRVPSGRSPICSVTSAGCTAGSRRSSSRPATIRPITGRTRSRRRPDVRIDWFEDGVDLVTDALLRVDPTSPAWSWTDDRTAGFWARRQANETAVHRWDAQLADGRHRADRPRPRGRRYRRVLRS